jgi:penicillin-binding protein 1A
LVAGVWMGNDDNTPTHGASSMAAGVWRSFMAKLTDDIPVEQFPAVPRLGGREATITLSPVKPGRVTADTAPSHSSESASSSGGESRQTASSESPSSGGSDAAPSSSEGSLLPSSDDSSAGNLEPGEPAVDPGNTGDHTASEPAAPAIVPTNTAAPAPAPVPVAPAPAPLVAPPPPLETPPPASPGE